MAITVYMVGVISILPSGLVMACNLTACTNTARGSQAEIASWFSGQGGAPDSYVCL